MLKRDTRVKMGDKIGTVIGNSYRLVCENERYCEVLFDGSEYIDTVKVDNLEIL